MPRTKSIAGSLGIIAGRGDLPCAIAEAAVASGIPLHIVGIRGEATEAIERFPHTWMKWGEIGKLFSALSDNHCTDIVIIGGVNRPDFDNVRFDLGAIKTLPFLLSLAKGGDDYLLSRIVRFFEDKGYRVRGAGDVLPELLMPEGTLPRKAHPPKTERTSRPRSRLCILSDILTSARRRWPGHVLAVEAAEGTDALLERCAAVRLQGRVHGTKSGVLVKAPKPGQEERIDMPTIGPETMHKAAAAGLAGVAVAAGHVLLADRAETIKAANAHKLFLVGEPWSGADANG
ncbi:LpxI family protein [Methyloceanibacter marginalis]|uniref:LpxI family protein n=1 Tax=Methyloceanibacter marginalis TaxID=1774971 RepID=UPI0013019382|nr:UDP-2,3-diacylglucosamine diphosphatase LpxI [Methyloceanibacter marginalis]